jgi:prenyltransferase/squalene oxidase-like repeat protein
LNTQGDDAAAVKNAVERSVPLLQGVGPKFIEYSGCISCHHNSLPAMAVALARERGVKVDDRIAQENTAATYRKVEQVRERLLFGTGAPGNATTTGYTLMGLAADKQPADKNTDAMIHYLLGKQSKDGRWKPVSYRPPMEFSDFTTTAVTLRALRLYAPKGRGEEVARRADQAREWLAAATPSTNEERAFQLLGLRWANAKQSDLHKAVKGLLAAQREDGGWAQLPTLESDAYATGQSLVALHQAGDLSVDDPAYRRGVKFLLKTQLQDGSWLIRTRALPFQRYFESGFPHGKDQWISAAGTSWATMALAFVLPVSKMKRTSASRLKSSTTPLARPALSFSLLPIPISSGVRAPGRKAGGAGR